LKKTGATLDRFTFRAAARHGRIWVLKWLHENGYDILDPDICWSAAQGGHLDVIQWARENDCPWDANLCAEAAEHGHLHVLKGARKMGCPWDGETRKYAQGYAQLNEGGKEMLDWVIENQSN
jgi:hypothetical protein